MTADSLDVAIEEASRFLRRARKLRGIARLHRIRTKEDIFAVNGAETERTVLTQASMDLTRALAELREGR